MTTIPHNSAPPDDEQKPWSRVIVRETWASVAITVIWETERESYRGRTDHAAVVFVSDGAHFYWDALDALAEVMEDRKRLILAHRRELNAEIREAQRGARDAYQEGRYDSVRGEC